MQSPGVIGFKLQTAIKGTVELLLKICFSDFLILVMSLSSSLGIQEI